jgi:hypothetical protein
VLKVRHVLVVLLAGSIWGVVEAVGGGTLYAHGVVGSSVLLSAVGLAILALARFLVPVRGTSLLVAAVAVAHRWVNVGYFPCHLAAILCLGGVFEVLAGFLGERLRARRAQLLLGAGTGVLGFALFAVLMAYVVRYSFWVGQPSKVAQQFLLGGVVGALGLVIVPLMHGAASRLAPRLEAATRAQPAASLGVGLAALLVFWLGV